MDMYQKRKMRAEKKKEDKSQNTQATNINWYKPPYGKLPMNACK